MPYCRWYRVFYIKSVQLLLHQKSFSAIFSRSELALSFLKQFGSEKRRLILVHLHASFRVSNYRMQINEGFNGKVPSDVRRWKNRLKAYAGNEPQLRAQHALYSAMLREKYPGRHYHMSHFAQCSAETDLELHS